MLRDNDALATIAVKDIKASRKFYEDTLGLTLDGSGDGGVIRFLSGNSKILIYQSQFAGTNQATAVTWAVDDVDGVVKALKAKGVTFEHYDFPGITREGDVHVIGNVRNAWFKDPDGNILSVVNRAEMPT
jgi:catechol 2,3-dioxygenase-like lactoylglutathione lyase family enzyme